MVDILHVPTTCTTWLVIITTHGGSTEESRPCVSLSRGQGQNSGKGKGQGKEDGGWFSRRHAPQAIMQQRLRRGVNKGSKKYELTPTLLTWLWMCHSCQQCVFHVNNASLISTMFKSCVSEKQPIFICWHEWHICCKNQSSRVSRACLMVRLWPHWQSG